MNDQLMSLIKQVSEENAEVLSNISGLPARMKFVEGVTCILIRTLSLCHEKDMRELTNQLFTEILGVINRSEGKGHEHSASRN